MLPIAAPPAIASTPPSLAVVDTTAPTGVLTAPATGLPTTQPILAGEDLSVFAQLLAPMADAAAGLATVDLASATTANAAVISDAAFGETTIAHAAPALDLPALPDESLADLLPAAVPPSEPGDGANDDELLALLSAFAAYVPPAPVATIDSATAAASLPILPPTAAAPMLSPAPGLPATPMALTAPVQPAAIATAPVAADLLEPPAQPMPAAPAGPASPVANAQQPAMALGDGESGLPAHAAAAATIATAPDTRPANRQTRNAAPANLAPVTPNAPVATSAPATASPVETAVQPIGPQPKREHIDLASIPAEPAVDQMVDAVAQQTVQPPAISGDAQRPVAMETQPGPAPVAAGTKAVAASSSAHAVERMPAAVMSTPAVSDSDDGGTAAEPPRSVAPAATAPAPAPASSEPAPQALAATPRTEPMSAARAEATHAASSRPEPNPLDRAVAHQVSRAIVQHLPDGGTRMVMRLTPPELGTVRIEFISRDGMVTARMMAEDEGVRQALDRALPHIRAEVRGDHPTVDITIDRSDQRQAWSDGQARQERRGEQSTARERRRRDDDPVFAIDGIEPAAPAPTPLRAAPQLGGRITRASVDALA